MFASQPTPQLSQPASSGAQTKQDVSPRTWVSHVPLSGCLCCTCTLALHGMHHVLLATGLSKGSVLPGVTETCHWSTHTGQPKQCSAQGATRAAGASSSLVSTLVYTDHIERPGQKPHYTHTHTHLTPQGWKGLPLSLVTVCPGHSYSCTQHEHW